MINKLLLISGIFITLVLPSAHIYAETNVLDPACAGFSASDPDAPTLCKDNQVKQSTSDNSIYGKNGIISKVVQLLAILIGIVAVIMVIIGGFKYVMSSGNPESINSAKNTILYAIIGLVVAVLAQYIIIFVISKL